MRKIWLWPWALALAALPCAAQTVQDPALEVELVASGLALPTGMAFVAENDILVIQKNDGWVRRILDGVLLQQPVLDVAVHSSSERGLLGIATDPDFVNNRAVYLYYTESSTGEDTSSSTSAPLGNRVYRTTWTGSALIEPVLVLDLPATPGPNHDGGIIVFGPDDALYAVIGDLNRQGKLQNVPDGADPDDTGVILRVGRDGQALPDSPFFDFSRAADPLGRVYAYGVRNSFGLAFDPVSGDLWDTENGPNSFDEVNHVVAGLNSGWRVLMGPDERDPDDPAQLWVAPGSIYRDPEFSWLNPVAPTALAFDESPVLGCDLQHDLIVADSNCGQLYRFRLNPQRDGLEFLSGALQDRVADNFAQRCSREMDEILFGSGWGTITDLETGADGRLYVVSLGRGAVYRIGPVAGAFPDADGDGVEDSCDCGPLQAEAFAFPAEVPRLRISGSPVTTLGWDAQASTAGAGTTYALASGDLETLRAEGGFASACTLASGLSTPAFQDGQVPAPGAAVYFLARAGNACGDGTYGDSTTAADARDALDAGVVPPCLCPERDGGALITFSVVNETLSVWITDDTFIDRALQLLDAGETQVPLFQALVDGPDCDPQWSWHVDPQQVSFADFTIEVCDGLPSDIEQNKEYWLETVGSYCPWSGVVMAVDDRR
ncbi:MAG: PQQ-dependent sugar dehydrogenase [Acidobacteriota bacterium]